MHFALRIPLRQKPKYPTQLNKGRRQAALSQFERLARRTLSPARVACTLHCSPSRLPGPPDVEHVAREEACTLHCSLF